MTEKDLFREIGMIDEKYVEEANSMKRAKILTPAFRRTLATAACLCICVGIYFTVRSVREESEESAKDFAGAEMMTATADGTSARGDSNEKAEGFDAIGEMFEEMTGASNSMSDGTAMETQKNQETEEDAVCDSAPEENEAVSSESAIAERFENTLARLSEYSDDYEKLCNGDAFVVTHGEVSAGMDKWETFMTKYSRGEEAQVDVIRFTVEGDAIITGVYYEGGVFYLVEDSTRDAWGSGTYTEYEFTCMNVIENSEGYTEVVFADQHIADLQAIDLQEVPMYYLVQYKELY